MTREDELLKRAEETTEQLLAEGVCLSDGECGIVDRVILQAFQQVEREVLERVDKFLDNADHMGDVRNWLYDQQKELG